MISATLEELEKLQGQRCLWCLVITASRLDGSKYSTLHIYQSDVSRERGLRYFQREYKLTDEVYHTFEIPVDVYLNGAKKYI